MSDSKMFAEIREQPEALERILEEGWGEILSATRALRRGDLRSVMIEELGGYPYDRDPGRPGAYALVPKQRFSDPSVSVEPDLSAR
jgi:hypothetical protein